MRIRTIKPEFFTHPSIVVLSMPARLLLISLLTQADDEGRLYDQPRRIGGNAFSEDDPNDPEEVLQELAATGRILRYEVGGRRCIQIHDFTEHQSISKLRPSKLPAPIDSGSPPGVVPERSGKAPRGNGMEGNREPGREGNLKNKPSRRIPTEVDASTGNGKVQGGGARAPRARDELFESILEVCGWELGTLTADGRGRVNRAASQLRKLHVGPEDVRQFQAAWMIAYPDATLTPQAITGNWSDFAAGKLWTAARRRR